MTAIRNEKSGDCSAAPFLLRLRSSHCAFVHLALACLSLLTVLLLSELLRVAPPTEKEEKAAYQWLYQLFYERDPGIQASPNWCEACKALGRTRDPELVTGMEKYMWREDARVKNDRALEHYPALLSLAEIGTPALRTLANAARKCQDDREATVLAAAFAKLYGQQRFAESYLKAELRRAKEVDKDQAAGVQRVLDVFRKAG